jgi:hypothetical protein
MRQTWRGEYGNRYDRQSRLVLAVDLLIEKSGMRPESRERVRARPDSRPLVVTFYPDVDAPVLTDGRHRLEAAQEQGASRMPAAFHFVGARGGVTAKRGVILLG